MLTTSCLFFTLRWDRLWPEDTLDCSLFRYTFLYELENILEVYAGVSGASAIGMVVQGFLDSRYALEWIGELKKSELQGGDPVTLVAECCAMTKDCVVPLQWAQLSGRAGSIFWVLWLAWCAAKHWYPSAWTPKESQGVCYNLLAFAR